MSRCKISVIKRCYFPELAQEYWNNPETGPCHIFADGQAFVIDRPNILTYVPQGFCAEAWRCILPYVFAALQGAPPIGQGFTKDERVTVTCCNDGIRPVVFRIERLDD